MTVGSQYAVTNSSGNYTLSSIASGNESVTISKSAYRPLTRVVTVPQNSTGTDNFTLVPCNAATTWYVATTGNDSTGDGSASYPYATIDHTDKIGVLSSGDVVYVDPGTYYVNTSSTGVGVHITAASNGVLYQADCAGATIQQVGNSSLQGNVVQIDGSMLTTAQTFTGFTVVGNQPASDLYVTNTTATVANCVFNAPNSWVIVYFNTVNSGTFRNNVIVSGEMWLNDTHDYGSNPGVYVINNTWVGSCNNMAAFYTGSWTARRALMCSRTISSAAATGAV